MDSAALRAVFRSQRVIWTLHAVLEAAADAMGQDEAEAAVAKDGEVIEDYPGDVRGASCLVLAHLADGRPLHMVIGYAREPFRIITVYRPDLRPELWSPDFRTRRRD
jgi:hypothetical protein